ncbi:MAG: NrfD/PsrC family molybdoenzyme membrane anchor subunit [Thermodesulfobacteriota bacterium]
MPANQDFIPETKINRDLLRPVIETTGRFYLTVAILGLVVLNGLVAFMYQMATGMGVAGLNRPVFWGLYITNFVFWVGISHAGTLLSAILRITNAQWRRPMTRAAEALTVFALMIAGLFPLVHLGRTWTFYFLIPYPSQRGIWPNFRSPLLWDAIAIFTYYVGSILFLYISMVPDLGLARDRVGGWRKEIYRVLSLGWRGTAREWHRVKRAGTIMAMLIVPVFVSVHTIVSWDFGMTLVPGWHSTIFGPYFVIGAILSGVAAVITLMIILRWALGLKEYLTLTQFDNLGKILGAVSLAWFYFFFAEFLTIWYGQVPEEMAVIRHRTFGQYALAFWVVLFCNFLIPLPALIFKRVRTSIPAMLVLTIVINVGMFLERYLIIVPSLARQRFPAAWGSYFPSWVEISIMAGAFCGFALMYVIFAKIFPIIPIWEVKEGQHIQRST